MSIRKCVIRSGFLGTMAAAWCLAGSAMAMQDSLLTDEPSFEIAPAKAVAEEVTVWSYDSLADDAAAVEEDEEALFAARHRIHVPDMTENGWNYMGLRTSSGGTEYGQAYEVSVSKADEVSIKAGVANGGAGHSPMAFIWNPVSFSVTSGCIGSACGGSGCLGSGCGASGCLGSACGGSGCGGSGCSVSVCGASGCGASLCAGSGCGGSGCAGSVCLGSGCGGSVCLASGCGVSGCGGSACYSSGCLGSACHGSACHGSACFASGCMLSACTQQNCNPAPAPATPATPQQAPHITLDGRIYGTPDASGVITVPTWTADAALANDRLTVIAG